MASDILTVYQKLGGVKWLLTWAQANESEFIRQGLSRLFPSPAKDEPDAVFNTQVNFDLSPMEVARRVAFALAGGVYPDPAVATRDITQEAVRQAPVAPRESEPPLLQPEPVEDPDQIRWAAELHLTPQERADQALVRQTKEASLGNYPGSGAEQGLSAPRQSDAPASGRTVSELRRRQLRRDELL